MCYSADSGTGQAWDATSHLLESDGSIRANIYARNTVALAAKLQQVLEQANTAMLTHPQHQLAPLYRRCIYSALDSVTDNRGQLARARLALLTARHVLPIWKQGRPDDSLPEKVLKWRKVLCPGR